MIIIHGYLLWEVRFTQVDTTNFWSLRELWSFELILEYKNGYALLKEYKWRQNCYSVI